VTGAAERLAAFLASLEHRTADLHGTCADCDTPDVRLYNDPDLGLRPDAYCATCVNRRVEALRAHLAKGVIA